MEDIIINHPNRGQLTLQDFEDWNNLKLDFNSHDNQALINKIKEQATITEAYKNLLYNRGYSQEWIDDNLDDFDKKDSQQDYTP